MKISVVMSVYNENIQELNESINSILNQTYSNFEYIIVDDNPISIDIKKFLLFKQQKDKRIRIIFNKNNLGVTNSINKGIKYSNGYFIARMDADDISDKSRFEKQLNFIKLNNLDLICSNFADMNSKLKYFGNKNMINQSYIKKIMSHCNIAMGPTLLFKRNIFKQLYEYRNILSEDYDLVVRSLIYNYNVGYQSNVFVYKRNRDNNLSNNNGLNEFVTNIIISNSLSNSNIESLSYINYRINNIKQSDKYKFKKFKFHFNKFKNNRSFFNLLMAFKYTCSSLLILKRNLWMVFINGKYKNFI